MEQAEVKERLKKLYPNLTDLIDGNIDISQKEKEYEQIEKDNLESKKEYYIKQSGVGERYWNCKLQDFVTETEEIKKNLEVVKSFITDVNNGIPRTLWLCGNNGNGKTMLASIIVRETFGYFADIYKIDDELCDARSFNNKENRKQVFKRYSNYKLLAIDEVGRFPNDDEKKTLFHILNDRYANNKSTVIVSNLSKKDLSEYFGKALYDRFTENCTSLQFAETSFRLKIREKK